MKSKSGASLSSSHTKSKPDEMFFAQLPWSRRASHWWQPRQSSHMHFSDQMTDSCFLSPHQPSHLRCHTQFEFFPSISHFERGAPGHRESFPTHSPSVSGNTGSHWQWTPLLPSFKHHSSFLPAQRESVPMQCLGVVVVVVLETVVVEVTVLDSMSHSEHPTQSVHPHFSPQFLKCVWHHVSHLSFHVQSELSASVSHLERGLPRHRESVPTHSPFVSGSTSSHRQ